MLQNFSLRALRRRATRSTSARWARRARTPGARPSSSTPLRRCAAPRRALRVCLSLPLIFDPQVGCTLWLDAGLELRQAHHPCRSSSCAYCRRCRCCCHSSSLLSLLTPLRAAVARAHRRAHRGRRRLPRHQRLAIAQPLHPPGSHRVARSTPAPARQPRGTASPPVSAQG